jgi:hypothetical protein
MLLFFVSDLLESVFLSFWQDHDRNQSIHSSRHDVEVRLESRHFLGGLHIISSAEPVFLRLDDTCMEEPVIILLMNKDYNVSR